MKKPTKTGAKVMTGDGMSPSKMPPPKAKGGAKMPPKMGLAAMKKGRPF